MLRVLGDSSDKPKIASSVDVNQLWKVQFFFLIYALIVLLSSYPAGKDPNMYV